MPDTRLGLSWQVDMNMSNDLDFWQFLFLAFLMVQDGCVFHPLQHTARPSHAAFSAGVVAVLLSHVLAGADAGRTTSSLGTQPVQTWWARPPRGLLMLFPGAWHCVGIASTSL